MTNNVAPNSAQPRIISMKFEGIISAHIVIDNNRIMTIAIIVIAQYFNRLYLGTL